MQQRVNIHTKIQRCADIAAYTAMLHDDSNQNFIRLTFNCLILSVANLNLRCRTNLCMHAGLLFEGVNDLFSYFSFENNFEINIHTLCDTKLRGNNCSFYEIIFPIQKQ